MDANRELPAGGRMANRVQSGATLLLGQALDPSGDDVFDT
jgi:hypothetical protein